MSVYCHVLLQHWFKLTKSGGGPWPEERDSHEACCLNYGQQFPQLLVTGGLDRQNKPLSDVWILDIERGRWRKVRPTILFTVCNVYVLSRWSVYTMYMYIHRNNATVTYNMHACILEFSCFLEYFPRILFFRTLRSYSRARTIQGNTVLCLIHSCTCSSLYNI